VFQIEDDLHDFNGSISFSFKSVEGILMQNTDSPLTEQGEKLKNTVWKRLFEHLPRSRW